jgi:Cof subfamily protein (haloacid dehalogenase superfamily)
MYKLIATDLDGTLLNDQKKINPNNAEYIKKALDLGVKIVLCSGRSHFSIHAFEEELNLVKLENYGIGLNGSMIYNSHTKLPIRHLLLDNSSAVKVLKELEQFNLEVVVFTGTTWIINVPKEKSRFYSVTTNEEFEIISDLTKIDIDVSKIIIIGENSKLKEIESYMKDFLGGLCNVCFTQTNFLEFTNIDAHKGAALKVLAEHLGISMKEVIAVGDNYNDITMLQEAGVGVAVSNAEDDVKKVADYITKSSNNDGALKEIIEKYIL